MWKNKNQSPFHLTRHFKTYSKILYASNYLVKNSPQRWDHLSIESREPSQTFSQLHQLWPHACNLWGARYRLESISTFSCPIVPSLLLPSPLCSRLPQNLVLLLWHKRKIYTVIKINKLRNINRFDYWAKYFEVLLF